MSFTVAGIDAPSGRIVQPRRGVWTALISLSTEEPPALAARVVIQAGSLTASGTVTNRGSLASMSDVEITGGAAGWRKVLSPPPLGGYRADNLVRLSQVVADLAVSTGETAVLEPGAERGLGYAWTRAAGPAATALEEVTNGAWWVDLPGVTHVGARPQGTRIKAPWTILPATSPASSCLMFAAQAEDLAAFVIGGELAGEGLDAFVIGALELRWAASTIRLTAWRR